MEKYINPNAFKASNLLRISALLCLIDYFLLSDHRSVFDDRVLLLTVGLLIGVAFLIRRGYKWVKWVLLVLFFPGIVIAAISLPLIFKSSVIDGWISVLQNIIQTVALILLFIPYKPVIP